MWWIFAIIASVFDALNSGSGGRPRSGGDGGGCGCLALVLFALFCTFLVRPGLIWLGW